ncbi:MAG: carboxymuconolactone decarboxylase family protein [Pseudomonadota bacterium]
MARLTQISDSDASPAAAELFGAIKSKVGAVPNLYRVMANEPAVLSAALGFNEALGKGSFDQKTREAIALTVAGANSCDYCASAHSAISKSLSVDEAEIAARLDGRSSDPKLDAILKFAVAVVDKRGFVSNDDLSAARNAGLSEGEIVETIGVVVANILTNYINHVAQTDIDFPVVRTKAA